MEGNSDSEDDVMVRKRRQPNKVDPFASQMVKNDVQHVLCEMTDTAVKQAATQIFNTQRRSFYYIVI